ncbi:hypothetical protein [Sphaerisporangium sp. NPDC051011]|uniref:hypothetical protein n=1 Tax=Sphaerisporangium sp. NPDC051011 TaxID=3155792 RepID=UPI0033DE8433
MSSRRMATVALTASSAQVGRGAGTPPGLLARADALVARTAGREDADRHQRRA